MAYEQKGLRRQKVRYNSTNDDNPLTYQLVVDGAKVTPTSATIAVYAPGETSATLTATAMTKSGSLLTYALATTTTADYPVATGYRAEIVVTYSSKTYDRVVIFDVVKFLLDLSIGRDQLVAMDEQLTSAEWGGDGDFSELIIACRDDLQVMIEAHVIGSGKLLENMILDSAAVAPAARYYILSQFFMGKDSEKSDRYESRFEKLFKAALGSIQYDTDQDGFENSEVGGIQAIRLTT